MMGGKRKPVLKQVRTRQKPIALKAFGEKAGYPKWDHTLIVWQGCLSPPQLASPESGLNGGWRDPSPKSLVQIRTRKGILILPATKI